MAYPVRAKKGLGQHFLSDEKLAARIAGSLGFRGPVLEIGPGTGILTRPLMATEGIDLWMAEIDRESIAFLQREFPAYAHRIIEGDVLLLDLKSWFEGPFAVIGNFPYYISSQILFRVLEYRGQAKEVVCMLQKEVAARIHAPAGTRASGILSVLIQTYYNTDYLFTVAPGAFIPPPKVQSAVLRLNRNSLEKADCNEELLFRVVKTAFNQRRKTLRNALKPITNDIPDIVLPEKLLNSRAEQLSVEDFIELTRLLSPAS
jgi:16S rRNA (adenine1518-N6/adenine1519-N6)-dimethyltransferase